MAQTIELVEVGDTSIAQHICNVVADQIQAHTDDLDSYAENNTNSGIEGWFKVETVVALKKAGYEGVTVQNKGPDIKFNHRLPLSDVWNSRWVHSRVPIAFGGLKMVPVRTL